MRQIRTRQIKMDPVCRLGLRCLKKDEPLEACYSAGCPNSIHPSCFKKVMLAVAEDEWEGLLWQAVFQQQQEDARGSREQKQR